MSTLIVPRRTISIHVSDFWSYALDHQNEREKRKKKGKNNKRKENVHPSANRAT